MIKKVTINEYLILRAIHDVKILVASDERLQFILTIKNIPNKEKKIMIRE